MTSLEVCFRARVLLPVSLGLLLPRRSSLRSTRARREKGFLGRCGFFFLLDGREGRRPMSKRKNNRAPNPYLREAKVTNPLSTNLHRKKEVLRALKARGLVEDRKLERRIQKLMRAALGLSFLVLHCFLSSLRYASLPPTPSLHENSFHSLATAVNYLRPPTNSCSEGKVRPKVGWVTLRVCLSVAKEKWNVGTSQD